jgi:hypothetical protein
LEPLASDKSVLSPFVCLPLDVIPLAILIIGKVLPTVENEVRSLMEERPPDVVVRLHSQGHLYDCVLSVYPPGRPKKASFADGPLENEGNARLTAQVPHLRNKTLRPLNS